MVLQISSLHIHQQRTEDRNLAELSVPVRQGGQGRAWPEGRATNKSLPGGILPAPVQSGCHSLPSPCCHQLLCSTLPALLCVLHQTRINHSPLATVPHQDSPRSLRLPRKAPDPQAGHFTTQGFGQTDGSFPPACCTNSNSRANRDLMATSGKVRTTHLPSSFLRGPVLGEILCKRLSLCTSTAHPLSSIITPLTPPNSSSHTTFCFHTSPHVGTCLRQCLPLPFCPAAQEWKRWIVPS